MNASFVTSIAKEYAEENGTVFNNTNLEIKDLLVSKQSVYLTRDELLQYFPWLSEGILPTDATAEVSAQLLHYEERIAIFLDILSAEGGVSIDLPLNEVETPWVWKKYVQYRLMLRSLQNK